MKAVPKHAHLAIALFVAVGVSNCSSTLTLRDGTELHGSAERVSVHAIRVVDGPESVEVAVADVLDVHHTSGDAAIAFGVLGLAGIALEVGSLYQFERVANEPGDNPALFGLAVTGALMAGTGLIGGIVASAIYIDDLVNEVGWFDDVALAPWVAPGQGDAAAGAALRVTF